MSMTTKKLNQINAFFKLAGEKFKDSEKIQYAIKVRFTPQIEKVNEQIGVIREPYNDSLILKGMVHDEGEKKGSLIRDEKGDILYTPQVEIELRKEQQRAEKSILDYLFEIATYYLKEESKPKDFTDEDKEVFEGFIEFVD